MIKGPEEEAEKKLKKAVRKAQSKAKKKARREARRRKKQGWVAWVVEWLGDIRLPIPRWTDPKGYVLRAGPIILHPLYTLYTLLEPYIHLCTPVMHVYTNTSYIHTIHTPNTPLNTLYTP